MNLEKAVLVIALKKEFFKNFCSFIKWQALCIKWNDSVMKNSETVTNFYRKRENNSI